jgi:pyruvate dehydrogenase E1 component alpha subunit
VELTRIDREAKQLIENAVVRAKAAPKPAASDLTTDVYVSY